MTRQRSHSIAFKRQVAQEFIAGESLYALSKRHDISRQLIRSGFRSMKRAPWTKTPRLPIYSRNMKPRLRRWIHGPARQSLRQRQGRELHEDTQGRSRVSDGIRNLRGRYSRPSPLHRRGLQHPQTPLRVRLSEPCAIRGSPRPATCQNRRLKLSTIKGALQTEVDRVDICTASARHVCPGKAFRRACARQYPSDLLPPRHRNDIYVIAVTSDGQPCVSCITSWQRPASLNSWASEWHAGKPSGATP
jgi:hypothetical protein